MASRVPLLIKGKPRKPSRVSIAPRATLSHAPRTERLTTPKATTPDSTPIEAYKPPMEPLATQKATSLASSVDQSLATSSASLLTTTSAVADALSPRMVVQSPSTRLPPSVRSSTVLPVQRLAKITSAGPLYRASPVVRPRKGTLSNSPRIRNRLTYSSPARSAPTALKVRLQSKLDIKPHQSPRRLQQQLTPASPLVLGGKGSSVPPIQLDVQLLEPHATLPTTTNPTKKRSLKRRKTSTALKLQATVSPRKSSRRQVKRVDYAAISGTTSSASEREDDDTLELPTDETIVYVPARERATLWAKSLLVREDKEEHVNTISSRKKRSRSTATGAGINTGIASRKNMATLMTKLPSEMTMGEVALSVPRGRHMEQHEREEAVTETSSGISDSTAWETKAVNRMRSISDASESMAYAGSIVTPQVQMINGQMVVVETTLKLCDEPLQEDSGLPPRHMNSRLNSSHLNGPGRRWGKEETKQFYYCLSQVGPNFSMMATLFTSRKRKELKSKFKYEEKHHGRLIEIALRASTAPLDTDMVDVISQMVDKKALQKQMPKTSEIRLNDDGASAPNSTCASPLSATGSVPQVQAEDFIETLQDSDLFSLGRHASFDYSN
ncbi:uncharacterized protein CCR75_003138 [Bremia lactucae]|uniref:Transcription factor TFIIIB component B'' Myb domain-containing protein n=1 Tax=Bremia lactucae TaxID=4779 RepID=A0A976NYH5_BRELC|nr:hypothetical protein CCR75_004544 [Bremia lactucae]TDH72492.1 hypothetical protein CCR75_003138 [Bremia lactucae]